MTHEEKWDAETTKMEAFRVSMNALGRSTDQWRQDIHQGTVSYKDSIAGVLLRLRLAMREGELILERVAGLAKEAPLGDRGSERFAVECARKIIEPFRDAVIKAQDIADRKDLSDVQKQTAIFHLASNLNTISV